ncbi:MAG: bi-domain-containing oxidoreductase, partial [Ginsengibacter sp.]
MSRIVSQNYKTGKISLITSQLPALKSGGVLVKTSYSLISAGTEGMKVREGKMNYFEKAKARPDQVKKVLESVRQQGLLSTYQKVINKLDSLTPLGYSTSGIVVEVASDVHELEVGQLVACAGAGYANHAELNFVPKNLVVPVPLNVSQEHAAFTTVGAIAMQGYRQAEMQLGEVACVIGLGLLGQILVQILKAGGVEVIGVDISENRCRLAEKAGAGFAGHPDDKSVRSAIKAMTSGFGADVIFITAGGDSNGPAELAVEVARDRGRVVDIGKTKLDLSWKDYYEKEIDVRFSRSYGPGRYDSNYEEKGIDYPIGYVRWTERRNMESFLNLISHKKIDLDLIISDIFSFSQAEEVYQKLSEGKLTGIGVLFKYEENNKVGHSDKGNKKVAFAGEVKGSIKHIVNIGIIGAGNYASSMLLPHLKNNPDAKLLQVATATPLSGENAKRKFLFEESTTDYELMLTRQDIDAVIIATRHKAHASMTVNVLKHGKAVFVEKPLAIDIEGLEKIRETIIETGNDRIQVGFNRRFSPMVIKMKKNLSQIIQPLIITYRVHAGQMDANSWYLDTDEGSRFIGEAGHFIDVISFL